MKQNNECSHEFHHTHNKQQLWNYKYATYDHEIKGSAITEEVTTVIYCIHCGKTDVVRNPLINNLNNNEQTS